MAPTNRGTVVPKSALPRVLEMPKVVPAKLGAISMKEEKKPGEMAPLKKKPMHIWEVSLYQRGLQRANPNST